MQVNRKDIAAGGLFIAIGAFFALNAWFNLRIGRPFNMGPGYFPVVLGLVLIGFGLAVAASAVGKPSELFGAVSWRGVVLVTAAIIFFAATVRGLGLAASFAITTFMAAMSPKEATLVPAVLLSIGMSIFGVVIFIYALGLPYPVIGPWLGGYR